MVKTSDPWTSKEKYFEPDHLCSIAYSQLVIAHAIHCALQYCGVH